MIVATLHGIWGGRDGYATPFVSGVARALRGRVLSFEGHWPGAWLGPAALVALRVPAFRRRAEATLDVALRAAAGAPVVLVTHSLGCEIARGWLVRTRPDAVALWVTAGAFGRLLGFTGAAARALLPLSTRVALALASRADPPSLPIDLPWLNCYYPDDVLGQPLAPFGAGCRDLALPLPTTVFEGHRRYWGDPAFAAAVAAALPEEAPP